MSDNSRNVKIQKKLMKKTQKRLNKLLKQIKRMHAKINKRANDNDVFEDFMARTFASMITQGLTIPPFQSRGVITTTTLASLQADAASLQADAEPDVTSNICNDIRGRDRACCNTAVRCFDDVSSSIDDLKNSPNDFTLLSACRQVSADLRDDKQCVRRSLLRCNGPGRVMLQRRFDGRVGNLYDQFYKNCREGLLPPKSTTSAPPPSIFPVTHPVTQFTTRPPPDHGHNGHDHSSQNTQIGNDVTSTSSAIIAGAITGGIILLLVLLVAVILWCKSRRDSNGSDSSTESSAGVFFQKRPNIFSTDRPNSNNNNKHAATRQDSSVYAEIDEGLVNPNYKPPVPPENMGYIHPVGENNPVMSNSRSASVPMALTRGQLSYGPILAAAQNSASGNPVFYHSTSISSPNDLQNIREQQSYLGSGEDSQLSRRLLLSSTNTERSDNSYVLSDLSPTSDQDDYEEPVSAQSSLHYEQLDTGINPPEEYAPAVPDEPKTNTGPHRHSAIKVLPSNPLAPPTSNPVFLSPNPVTTPQAKPRRKKLQNDSESAMPEVGKQMDKEKVKSMDMSNRDSQVSNKSSHHYFVLEPGADLDYENSVSAPKLV